MAPVPGCKARWWWCSLIPRPTWGHVRDGLGTRLVVVLVAVAVVGRWLSRGGVVAHVQYPDSHTHSSHGGINCGVCIAEPTAPVNVLGHCASVCLAFYMCSTP